MVWRICLPLSKYFDTNVLTFVCKTGVATVCLLCWNSNYIHTHIHIQVQTWTHTHTEHTQVFLQLIFTLSTVCHCIFDKYSVTLFAAGVKRQPTSLTLLISGVYIVLRTYLVLAAWCVLTEWSDIFLLFTQFIFSTQYTILCTVWTCKLKQLILLILRPCIFTNLSNSFLILNLFITHWKISFKFFLFCKMNNNLE